MLKKFLQAYQDNSFSLILIFLGSFSWALTVVKSGLAYPFGIGFWGPNGHDGIWHVALANSFARGSWEIPVFSGELIKNYHIGFDLIVAGIHKLTKLPVTLLYFQIIPVLMAVLVGYSAYRFVLQLTHSRYQAFWATFFVYFGGSFGWVITLIRDLKVDGESLFWAQQSVSTLINPPFALSLIILFFGLGFLSQGIQTENQKSLMLATFLFGILAQIKIYAAVLIIPSLFLIGFFQIFRHRKITVIKVATGALVISLLLFFPTAEAKNTIVFSPFWFLRELMSTPDRLYWPRYAEAMVNYVLANNWLKALVSYGTAFLIFLIGNFGTRLLFFLWFYKKGLNVFKYDYIDTILLVIIFAGLLLPTFFIQSGTNWNTIQFLYYSLVVSGILAGMVLGKYIENVLTSKKSKLAVNDMLIVVIAVVMLTIPTSIGTLTNHYLPSRPPAKISNDELAALNFLKHKPQGVVLTQPYRFFGNELLDVAPPRSLYAYESTAYVSAYTNKPTYLEDQVNLEITGYAWQARRNYVEDFFVEFGLENKYEFFKSNNIKYVYVVNSLQQNSKNEAYFENNLIFQNSEISIYEVK